MGHLQFTLWWNDPVLNKPEQAIKLPSNLYIWDTKTLSKIQKWKYNIIRTNEQHVSFWVWERNCLIFLRGWTACSHPLWSLPNVSVKIDLNKIATICNCRRKGPLVVEFQTKLNFKLWHHQWNILKVQVIGRSESMIFQPKFFLQKFSLNTEVHFYCINFRHPA